MCEDHTNDGTYSDMMKPMLTFSLILIMKSDTDGDCSPHKYSGGHHARDLADFVEDILRPVVLPLTVSQTKMMTFFIYT